MKNLLCSFALMGALLLSLVSTPALAQSNWTFTSGGTIVALDRVKFSGTNVVQAGVADESIGVAVDAAASTDKVQVMMYCSSDIAYFTADGAITAGVDVFPAASGHVSATRAGNTIGKALNATTNAGDIVKVVLPTAGSGTKVIPVYIAAATVSEFVFIADRPYTVVSISEVHSVVSSSGTCAVRKITGTHLAGAAVGSGVVELLSTTTGFDLTTTAGATVTGTLSTTATDYDIATGDKIAINIAGTMTGLVGGNITIVLKNK